MRAPRRSGWIPLRLPFWAAVKTGTSKTMRDNWCIGYSDRYTVAVWVGNLEGDPMRAVSRTSGAAPVWRDLMLALHAGRAGAAPARPAGIEQRAIAFGGRIEQPRREYFLAGTGRLVSPLCRPPPGDRRSSVPCRAASMRSTRIFRSSDSGSRVGVSGEVAAHRLMLDRRDLGAADARPLVLAGPGRHRIALVDLAGRIVDQVMFTVR